MARELVKLWGDRTLTVLELEDRISSAAEKAPSEDAGIMQLRQVLAQIRADYDAVISTEQASVRETGGCLLYTSPSPRDRQKSRMPSSA